MMKLVIQNACGEKMEIPKDQHLGSAIRFFSGDIGKLKEVSGMDEARSVEGVKYVLQFKENGSCIIDVHNSLDRVGCIIAQGRNNKEAMEICEKALEKIKVRVQK